MTAKQTVDKCRARHFSEMIVPRAQHPNDSAWISIDDLYDSQRFSPDTTQLIESELMRICGVHNDHISHTINIKRWKHAYSDSKLPLTNILRCVTNQEQLCRKKVYDEIYEFLTGISSTRYDIDGSKVKQSNMLHRMTMYYKAANLSLENLQNATIKLKESLKHEDLGVIASICPNHNFQCQDGRR